MPSNFSYRKLLASFFAALIVFFGISQEAFAKRPPEIRNQEELKISKDMHGQDLSGYEFVKFDLRGINLSETNLNGSVFNNSQLEGADLHDSDMTDALAYASRFDNSDLSNVIFSNALLMESSFTNVNINGADFTDAVLSRIQQKQLCSQAEGVNPITGVATTYSLGC